MFIHPEKLKANNEKGFTLVETLIALVVLTTAIIPVLYLANSSVNVAFNLQDDLIAAGLAQEGVEVIRGIRDTNWFNSRAFDATLNDGVIGNSTSYRVEWNSASPLPLNDGAVLNLNNSLYTYSGGTPSKFKRTVIITKVNAGELKVVSQVTWPTRTNLSKTITTEDHLFDWR